MSNENLIPIKIVLQCRVTSTFSWFILQETEAKAGFRAESNNVIDGTVTSSPMHVTASTARGCGIFVNIWDLEVGQAD